MSKIDPQIKFTPTKTLWIIKFPPIQKHYELSSSYKFKNTMNYQVPTNLKTLWIIKFPPIQKHYDLSNSHQYKKKGCHPQMQFRKWVF